MACYGVRHITILILMSACFFTCTDVTHAAAKAPSTKESPAKVEKTVSKTDSKKTTAQDEKANSKTNQKEQTSKAPSTPQEGQQEASSDIIASDYHSISYPSTRAKYVFLQDFESGAILFAKNPDALMTPSSMTKMVTASLIFDKIKSGVLSLDSTFTVSSQAYHKEGSTMFLKLGQKVSVEDLLSGLIIVSGNDAAITLAEGASGSEQAFAEEMTSFAHSIGAVNSQFTNSNGIPDPMHKSTARDLALIARHVITDYPYDLYSQDEFTFNGVTQHTRNTLLSKNIGCDGIKTGQTKEGGFGITATCVQDGRRLILVTNSYHSHSEREQDAVALLSWGTRAFVNRTLYKSNELVIQVPVWYGEESYLPVTVEAPVVVTLPRAMQKDLKVVLHYDTPISAPVKKGDKIGEIQISAHALKQPFRIPLIASVDIREAGFFKKVKDSFLYLIWGIRKPELGKTATKATPPEVEDPTQK